MNIIKVRHSEAIGIGLTISSYDHLEISHHRFTKPMESVGDYMRRHVVTSGSFCVTLDTGLTETGGVATVWPSEQSPYLNATTMDIQALEDNSSYICAYPIDRPYTRVDASKTVVDSSSSQVFSNRFVIIFRDTLKPKIIECSTPRTVELLQGDVVIQLWTVTEPT